MGVPSSRLEVWRPEVLRHSGSASRTCRRAGSFRAYEGFGEARAASRPSAIDDRPGEIKGIRREQVSRTDAAVDGLVVLLADARQESVPELKIRWIAPWTMSRRMIRHNRDVMRYIRSTRSR